MKQSFTIHGRLPGYNELKDGHWAKRASVKQDAMNAVMWAVRAERIRPVEAYPVQVTIACFEPNGRRDVDNVTSGASKIVLDALQRIGILQGDGRKYVSRVVHEAVQVDKQNPRVEVEIDAVHSANFPRQG